MSSFLFFSPFLSNSRDVDDFHILCMFTILTHWFINNNVCMLTELEYHFRKISGESISKYQTFFGKLIGPFYDGFDDACFTKMFIIFFCFCLIRYLTFYRI